MKHIKSFESKKEPEVGDYVILSPITKSDAPYQLFLCNSIGIISDIYNIRNSEIGVVYDNIPDDYRVKDYFSNNGYKIFYSHQIEHISKNKEELEGILTSKKYNL